MGKSFNELCDNDKIEVELFKRYVSEAIRVDEIGQYCCITARELKQMLRVHIAQQKEIDKLKAAHGKCYYGLSIIIDECSPPEGSLPSDRRRICNIRSIACHSRAAYTPESSHSTLKGVDR